MFIIHEEDMSMETYIRQEDGSIDYQKPSRKVTPMQEMCDHWIVFLNTDLLNGSTSFIAICFVTIQSIIEMNIL